ncbi:hypothetical protein A1O1_06076 [Capronia coronata CBS 617.96]|uniref:Calcofluor white hypersensitive protein n=1 Tax=Capronia coronata CBS 617.96 TaxID=1182541 RepID=W9XZN9_9EURO|nr:uncharacterized protein A1O1_06076 [Capronia coronata CBS 617.96]EXJ85708.1 hypothetical protein A1O1_06076 [Capronia coronata CBS 617.96]
MSRRGLTIAGLAVASGAGYYLYKAGGDPKTAEKRFEADASKLSADIKKELPGRQKEAEKTAQAWASQAGQKVDQTSAEAKAKLAKAEAETRSKLAEAEARAKELGAKTNKEFNSAVDKFDKTVEDKAAKAKSGLSSWFGGK